MGGSRISGACLTAVLVCGGCASPPILDLARNYYIYHSPGYEAPRRTAHAVYVQRLRDRRERPHANTATTTKKFYDETDWDRAVAVMVEEVLIDEIDRSGIYNGISSGSDGRPAGDDYVVEPTLTVMYRAREAMTQDNVGLRRTVAVTALRLRVRGPKRKGGTRRLLMDEVIAESVETPLSLARPERGIALAGISLQRVMKTALRKLYESNIQAIDDPDEVEAAAAKGLGKSGVEK